MMSPSSYSPPVICGSGRELASNHLNKEQFILTIMVLILLGLHSTVSFTPSECVISLDTSGSTDICPFHTWMSTLLVDVSHLTQLVGSPLWYNSLVPQTTVLSLSLFLWNTGPAFTSLKNQQYLLCMLPNGRVQRKAFLKVGLGARP